MLAQRTGYNPHAVKDHPDVYLDSEAAMLRFASTMAGRLHAGEIVLLSGELGAGKTTFARGVLLALGHQGDVRSPTFNLLQLYSTSPPVLHADLYRVHSAEGIGLEDFLESHLCLVEWPENSGAFFDVLPCWRIHIAFAGEGRRVRVTPPLREALA